jgi:hypothetical protein
MSSNKKEIDDKKEIDNKEDSNNTDVDSETDSSKDDDYETDIEDSSYVSEPEPEPESEEKNKKNCNNLINIIQQPKLASGIKYYNLLNKYINSDGLIFNIINFPTIIKIEEKLDIHIPKVAECTFNDRKNNPIRYTKKGTPAKNQKEIINREDYDGVLVNFKGTTNELWRKKDTEGIYFITFNKHVVKIGMTENSFSDRFGSYICGSRRAMYKGSCSTTNFTVCEVLYTALQLGLDVDIYGIQIPKERKKIKVYGHEINCPVSVVRAYEEIITNIYKNISGKIPPLCVQHSRNI